LVSRARLVLLASEGVANQDIAAQVGMSRPTVNRWRNRYVAKGIPGLVDVKRPGRPRKEAVLLANETAPPSDEVATTPPPVTSPDTSIVQGPGKTASDVRHDAVLVLKKVYTKGPAGQAKVDQVCKHFNVTKLVDVPLDKADELYQMSTAALAELGG